MGYRDVIGIWIACTRNCTHSYSGTYVVVLLRSDGLDFKLGILD